MIRIQSVSKSFDRPVICNLSMDVEEGATISLIGPSGCGKSTLLRMMTGIIQADSGNIFFGEQEVKPANYSSIRLNTGYVIQEGGLFPHLSARENVELPARYLGYSDVDIENRISETSALVHISDTMLSRHPGSLSGGQRQRISLMRALMLDPDYLLLDEPLASVDPMVRYELQQELKEIFSKLNKTVVLVTHDLGEAVYLGQKICLIKDGEIEQYSEAEKLINSPATNFVEQFINAQRSPLEEYRK